MVYCVMRQKLRNGVDHSGRQEAMRLYKPHYSLPVVRIYRFKDMVYIRQENKGCIRIG
jgi:hypothetical protein